MSSSGGASEWLKSGTVGFLGCGNMAQAMIRGFITSGCVPAGNILVSATSAESKNYKACKDMGVRCTVENSEVVADAKVIFVAVKPHLVKDVLLSLSFTADCLLVSVAANVSIANMCQWSRSQRVVRSMPNTASHVQQGVTAYCYDKSAKLSETEEAAVKMLMESIGLARFVSESLINPISAVCGSGIAYMFMALEAMSDGAVMAGVPRALSYELAAQTMAGAAAMLKETGNHPGQLKDAVCSPGGSTIAGVHSLEDDKFRGTIMNAIQATLNKVKELG